MFEIWRAMWSQEGVLRGQDWRSEVRQLLRTKAGRALQRQGNWKQTWPYYIKVNGKKVCAITDSPSERRNEKSWEEAWANRTELTVVLTKHFWEFRKLKYDVSFALSRTLMHVTDGTNVRKPEPSLRLE